MIKKIFGILAVLAIVIIPLSGLAQTSPSLTYLTNQSSTTAFTANYRFDGGYSQSTPVYAWVGEYPPESRFTNWTKDILLTTIPANNADPIFFSAAFNFSSYGNPTKTYGYLLANTTSESISTMFIAPPGTQGVGVRCFKTTGDVPCPTSSGGGTGGAGTAATFNYTGNPSVLCDNELEICDFKILIQPTSTGTLKFLVDAYPQNRFDNGDRAGFALVNQQTVSVTSGQQSQVSVSVPFSSILSFTTNNGRDTKFYFSFLEAQSNKESSLSGLFDTAAQGISAGAGGSLCGSAANRAATGQPTSGLCVPGSTAGSVLPDGSEWVWLCIPANGIGGEDCRTSATGGASPSTLDPNAYDGQCGTANGGTFATRSLFTGSLCAKGALGTVTGNGPWSWTCAGNGGTVANCSANPDTGDNRGSNFLQNPLAAGLDTFPKIFAAIYNGIILPVAIPFIAIAIMYSGFLFVIARKEGNAVKLDTAKMVFKYTMIGAALLLGGFVIANALQSTLCELLNNCSAAPTVV